MEKLADFFVTLRPRLLAPVMALMFTGVWSATSGAVEPWVDPTLKVQDGLVVWLDLSAQNRAREQAGVKPVADGDGIDVLRDGSGRANHLIQDQPAARPKYRAIDKLATASFDGVTTYLAHDRLGSFFDGLTVFLVAAPYSSDGGFPGLLATNGAGVNDYVSGITIDLGPVATDGFDAVNVEGAGFGGARDLKAARTPLLQITHLCVTSAVGTAGTKLYVDGQPAGQRDRTAGRIAMDQLTLGARYYGNGEAPHTQGFFTGEIAEVLVYDRVLADQERAEVGKYLTAKYGVGRAVDAPPAQAGFKPLAQVANPPAVQMLVPGFAVRELPVDLPNVNNVLYRGDGALVTLGYDGNIHLLTDTDGDGLEDHTKLFWENRGRIRAPVGMDLTPAKYPAGRGVFLASKARCLLVVDTDADDRADREITVADGWTETAHGVDALGMAFDRRDGSLWMGLGCQDFTNAYVVAADGKAAYDVLSERGAILHVSPDFQKRDVFATGIRFPVAIRLNRLNDLFCTDQEGATWLANGNPFDELLHVERGRHYGFPPRHPRHLPSVIDEPSVMDYAPQHQSTCGLNFNEPTSGGPAFGPTWWESDALVTGYSRGKLYRTKLIKTASGYVAQNQQIGAMQKLPADACVSPTGALVVAAHSGGPDWGSGPSGKGKLFQIRYVDRDMPQPVQIWPQTEREVWIAFDREVPPAQARELTSKTSIDFGPFVTPGDRFESLRPGYAVVAMQRRAGRHDLPVLGLQLTADRRNILLSTAPHAESGSYAVTLPGLGGARDETAKPGDIPQIHDVDLAYNLSGVDARYESASANRTWRGWLPHCDLAVSRTLTCKSAIHDDLWRFCRQPGTLLLSAQLDLRDMLRPAVQPGAKLDHEWPAEMVMLVCSSSARFDGTLDSLSISSKRDANSRFTARVAVPPDHPGATHKIELRLHVDASDTAPDFLMSWATNEDPRERALPLRRILLPWARHQREPAALVDNRDLPELRDGHWLRGRQIFFSDEAACSKCHQVRGEGGSIGPDLSNLVARDYASVLRDITEPSFAINPDFVAHAIVLGDGRLLTGTIRSQGDSVIVGSQDGKETTISRTEIEDVQPSPTSIMPQDIPRKLGPEKLRDLLTFLLVPGPHMPDYGKGTPPAARTMAEVRAVLADAPVEAANARPLDIVLVSGPKDHGPGEHDYPAWQKVWRELLSLADQTHVTTADHWPSPDQLAVADVMVFYQQGRFTPERAKDLDAYLARGGGLVYIHYAVDGGDDAPGFAERIGLAWRGGMSRFRHGELSIDLRPGADHPIARNLHHLNLHDESYWNLVGEQARLRLLGSGVEEGQSQPLFWTVEQGKGRVFVSIPGHFAWSFDDPLFRTVLLRGIAWAAHEPVDRFNELVTAGARLQSPASGKSAVAPKAP
ncbi:MAG TPA: ThuA domain-containing protein [Pirellulales bacterium]|nr:ThuA domain-containing protein [Pirellulales bacterium]